MGVTILPKKFYENMDRMTEALEKQVAINEVVDRSGSPGNNKLLAGSKNAGFLGFVPSAEFISGTALASALGISAGTSANADTPWIKYIWKGKVCFTPLKPIRHSITWDAIYAAGAVYATGDEGTLPPMGRMGTGLSIDATDNSINTTTQHFLGDKSEGMDYADTVGEVGDTLVLKGWSNADNNKSVAIESITNTKIVVSGATLKTEAGNRLSRLYKSTNAVTQNKTVTIGDLTYAVRLFRGASNDPTNSYADADRDAIGPDNEWNAIILPLHEHAKLQNWNYSAYAGVTEDWGVYLTDKDLVTHYNHGSGSYTWCQDVRDTTSWRRVYRGLYGASVLGSDSSWDVVSYGGFRPVLELPQTATL
jgi:hypothetical protein